jgi:hypothetical protein
MVSIDYERYHPRGDTLKVLLEAKKFAEAEKPVTVRQIFYHLVSKEILSNMENEYQKLDKILVRARKAGFIPFEWITDRSRNPLIVPVYDSISDYLQQRIQYYYKDTWKNQPYLVIILLEKEALSEIVWRVASYYNVPVFPTKGYPSWSILYEDLRKYVDKYPDKPLVMLTLGDYDPSGFDISRDYEEKLEFLGMSPDIVERVALTRDQVVKYQLPPLPMKSKDPRAERFKQEHGENVVELDALKPSLLRQIVNEAILKYINMEALKKDLETEVKEKETLQFLIEHELETYSDDIGEDG